MVQVTEKQSSEGGVSVKGSQAMQKPTPIHMMSPFEDMDRMFDTLFSRGWLKPFRWERPDLSELSTSFGRMPHVDVIDRDSEIVVRAELPGVDKKDIDISMTDNTVTIKASHLHKEKEKGDDYYRCEICRGAFSRMVALPGNIDRGKAKASFKDGMLELTLPKMEASKRHTIKIS